MKVGGVTRRAQHGGLGQAPHAVAAHLRLAAVGVLQDHPQIGRCTAVAIWITPSAPTPKLPVAQGAHQVDGQRSAAPRVDLDQEVVAGTVVLGEPEECARRARKWWSW